MFTENVCYPKKYVFQNKNTGMIVLVLPPQAFPDLETLRHIIVKFFGTNYYIGKGIILYC